MIKGHSEKWRSLQAEHLDRMRAQLAGRRATTAAQFTRGRPVQVADQQHSKNRWSFEVKQRELEETEELRRQAILTIRKAELRDATERFQRATSPRRSRPPSPARQRPSSAPVSRLRGHITTVTPTPPAGVQLGQPVVGSWVPAAASADGRASVAFAKKYGSHNEEQQHQQFEVIEPISAASSRKYGQPLQSVASNETINEHGDSSAALWQQRRHSTIWAPAWIASNDSLPRGRQPSPAAAAAEDATPLGSQSPSQRQTLVPARAARPSSAGAVMVGTEWQAAAVASGSASSVASVEQRRSLGRPTVTIPRVSAEPCTDVDDAAQRDSSSASSTAGDEWLASDALPTTRIETGRQQSPNRLLSHATRDAFDFSLSGVSSGPSSLKKGIDAAAVVSAEAALARDVTSSQSLSKTPKAVTSGAAGAAADLPVCSPSSHVLGGSNGTHERRSSRTAELDCAASSVETAPTAVRDGHRRAPVPPRSSRPPELLHLRRPASADVARLRTVPATSSAAAGSESAAVAASAATSPVVEASSNISSSVTEPSGQLPVDAAMRFGLYYIKSRTDSRLKEIVPGPPSGGDLGQLLLADSAVSDVPPSRGYGTPERNFNKEEGSNRRGNQITLPDRTEDSASTSAAAVAAAAAADAAAAANAAVAAAIDGRRVTKNLRVDDSLSSATSAARPRSAPGSRSSVAENDFFANAGDETLAPIGGSLVGESELKQPRSILKRPMSGHGVASSTGGNGIHSLSPIKDAYTTGSHCHDFSPPVSNESRHEGGTRRKSVRFSDDDSMQLVQRLQASALDGMNGLLGSVGGGGGGSGGDAVASEARTLRPTVGQPYRSAVQLLTSQRQTESGADVVAPANSPVGDTNGNTVVGDQLMNATTGIATPTDDVTHAYFKTDTTQLKREQQPRRVLPPATSVTLQSEQRPQQQQLIPNQQLAAQLVGVAQAWQNKQLHQSEALTTATPTVTPLMVSPSRAGMPAMSVFFPVEEQRLLNALEVLNRRLKINEDVTLSDRGTSAQNTRASTYRGHLSRSASQQDGISDADTES